MDALEESETNASAPQQKKFELKCDGTRVFERFKKCWIYLIKESEVCRGCRPSFEKSKYSQSVIYGDEDGGIVGGNN